MVGRSKRQRKQAHTGALRGKGVQQQPSALDLLLSDELKEQLLGDATADVDGRCVGRDPWRRRAPTPSAIAPPERDALPPNRL